MTPDRWTAHRQAALTHTTFREGKAPPSGPRILRDHEVLECLGDSVLGLIVREALIARFPDDGEQEITERQQGLISNPVLAQLCDEAGLTPHIRIGGSLRGRLHNEVNVRADVFEAWLGALYLDDGYPAARDFLLGLLAERLTRAVTAPVNPKKALQEAIQRATRAPGAPWSRVRAENVGGQGADAVHEVEIVLHPAFDPQATPFFGRARTIKDAEAEACAAALRQFFPEGLPRG